MPLVLVHGLAGSPRWWRPVLPLLHERDVRMVAPAELASLDEPVDLVGHSLGGLVAARVAALHPGLVHRLVLEDVGLPRSRPPAPPTRPEGVLPFDWRVVEQVRPEIDDPDPRWADVVAGIAAPTLVIAGGPSSPVPHDHVAELVALVPDGRLVTLDTGHLVHDTRPDEFTHHLLAFLGA